MLSPDHVERFYWPNGILEYEGPYINGLLHGIVRKWYSNGQIEFELPMTSGLRNGECKFWNEDGIFLGSYNMSMGTGLYKQWYPNGVLSCQFPMVNDKDHGVSYLWSENGALEHVSYHINGRKVSKKKYLEACETDPTLPRLDSATIASEDPVDQELAEWRVRQVERKASKAPQENSTSLQAFEEMIHAPATKEARKWLKEKSPLERVLGKLGSTENSLEFVKEGYAAGIKKIYAVKIAVIGEFEITRSLVVELPRSKKKRDTAFEWIVRTCAEQSGNDPPDDDGQAYVYIFLD